MIAAAHRAGARFSITARKDRAVTAAISAIPDDGWTAIRYPKAVFDEQLGQWVSDAEVAEMEQKAETDIAAAASRTGDELRNEIARLAGAAADRVVERSLDDAAQQRLIEDYIARVGASNGAPV